MAKQVPKHASATGKSGLRFSGEDRVMGVALLLVPLVLFAARSNWAPSLQFFLAVGAVVPLAAFIGSATEALADQLGGKIGGLLNATFGNSPDLLIGVFGVQKGLIPLVKATLVGALISNSALIMGLCAIVAGLRFRRPAFKRHEAGHHSVLLMLTVAALLFPSAGSLVLCGGTHCGSSAARSTMQQVSVGISVVLLITYVAYVMFAVFGLESLRGAEPVGRDARLLAQKHKESGRVGWPVWFAVLVLVLATVALIPVTDILTGSVEPVTRSLGWTTVFVGIIIVANAGNVAEAYAALKFAYQRGGVDPEEADSGLDLAVGIASASSIQIATFIAPVIVLYSLTGHNMNLVFSPVEVSILFLLAIIFAYIAHDGESNWLEGVMLVALYAMAAVVFFVLPPSVFGG